MVVYYQRNHKNQEKKGKRATGKWKGRKQSTYNPRKKVSTGSHLRNSTSPCWILITTPKKMRPVSLLSLRGDQSLEGLKA